MPDDSLERRKLWRHLMQCVLAEQDARAAYYAAPLPSIDSAEQRLLAEGLRVDAAIDALDADLTSHRKAS